MEFIHQYKKILLISFGAGLIVILALTFFLNRLQGTPKKGDDPTPSIINENLTPEVVISLEPAVQTGALDDNPSPEELAKTNQAFDLRNRSPYEGGVFQITYNYADDIFEVRLAEPKEQSREVFASWLQANYPLISLTRFIVIE